jgi:PPOX class probable F420-dependent enzyme
MTMLDDFARALIDGHSFATVATLNRDGGPQTSVVWIDRDGDAVVFSITDDKQKARNLARDPRISLTVFDRENPYRSVEVRGTAELIDDPKRELSYRLTHKYLGQDPPPDPPGSNRLIVRVTPERVVQFAA